MPSKFDIETLKEQIKQNQPLPAQLLHDLLESTHPDITEVQYLSIPVTFKTEFINPIPAPVGFPSSFNGTYEILTVTLSNKVTIFSGWIESTYKFTPISPGTVKFMIYPLADANKVFCNIPSKLPIWGDRWIGKVKKQWSAVNNEPNETQLKCGITGGAIAGNVIFTNKGIEIHSQEFTSESGAMLIELSGLVMSRQNTLSLTGSEFFVLVNKS